MKFNELESKLTLPQRKAAFLVLENEMRPTKERRTLDDIAAEVGVSRTALFNWRKENPVFIAYYNALADRQLDSFRGVADAQLKRLIEGTSNNGIASIKALELYYKLTARLVNRSEVTTNEIGDGPKRLSAAEIAEELAELAGLTK
ncbi:phBC6A51 family helix-turn-helix protein [Aneurinibacillus sp. REN35]|uniref:phBC6A51 family helix-turn-helix protein n=1 Tax=Aneurinibacillus sp. REN35 TaxID=3237286 RepID=UPI00352719C3